MAQRAQVVTGMRDIVPPEAELRRRVANRILDVYSQYGFEVIETPALEELEVLVGSNGGENEKLIFQVMKRGAKLEQARQHGEELADAGLRFDLTVPLARFVANHLNELPMPFKVAHIAPVWRAERPQRGRFREFTQCDIDIVGEPSTAAEVELCSATMVALSGIGIHGCTVRINDRRLLRWAVEDALGPLDKPDSVYIALDRLDRAGAEAVATELVAAGHDSQAVDRLVTTLASGQPVGPADLHGEVEQTISALRSQHFSVRFDPALVRGMGYYTGQIFEISHPSVPYSLAGGGRYDGMTARYGGPSLPMCGFSIGFERVCDMVDREIFSTGQQKVAVLCPGTEEMLRCFEVADRKRAEAPGSTFSVLRRARNVRKQQEDLAKLGYLEVVDARDFLA
jgi:histidyl-tRNA synthetase